jgi:hypothetical protein
VDRTKKNTLHVATRLPPDRVADLEPKLLVFAADDIGALYLANAVVRDAPEEQDFSDATALERAPAGEHVKYRGAASGAIRDAVRLMGFSGVRDTTTRVPLRSFTKDQQQALTGKCKEVFKLLDIQKPRVKDSPQKHITWARNTLRLMKIELKSKRNGHGRNRDRVTEYWLASECEGFFGLVEDFNPGGPTNPSEVPYSQRKRIVNVLKSQQTAISARELSRVDLLPVTAPWQPGGFVLASLVPNAGSLPHVGHAPPLAFADQCDAELAEFQGDLAAEEESADEMTEMGCYAGDGIPSHAELAELQAELTDSADEMELGCYVDGSSMQDDSDCCVDE